MGIETTPSATAIYRNDGNDTALALIPEDARRILDIGCGAGDNARRLGARGAATQVVGVTWSHAEAEQASRHCAAVHVLDLDRETVRDVGEPFDAILLSHVLEHLADPPHVLRSLVPLLRPGGCAVIVVPNVLEWRTRLALAGGRFEYADHGILDRTHLRFYTYYTAPRELVAPVEGLRLERVIAKGAAPLGPLRRRILSPTLRARVDEIAVRRWPNLFASEVAMLARRVEPPHEA
ncbi:class I SAM-dependent methyltransferase [Ramlibacter sp. PS4R-6]|uniref:class I SAM-dependent methyltransferase n=1 Tax=Ramlibacter sp. PS4R-6 TaxID=3133438 RepID=UPI0030B7175C